MYEEHPVLSSKARKKPSLGTMATEPGAAWEAELSGAGTAGPTPRTAVNKKKRFPGAQLLCQGGFQQRWEGSGLLLFYIRGQRSPTEPQQIGDSAGTQKHVCLNAKDRPFSPSGQCSQLGCH